MTRPASVTLRHGFSGLAIGVEAEVGPFVGITAGVFDLDRQAHQVCLEVACLVDRALALRIKTGHFQTDLMGLADRKSTRLNSSHQIISYAVFCLKKKNA